MKRRKPRASSASEELQCPQITMAETCKRARSWKPFLGCGSGPGEQHEGGEMPMCYPGSRKGSRDTIYQVLPGPHYNRRMI
ncbi:hypothetical protein BAUCODRAFT_466465 [Baudoinia panamericana UAMH 10762]|uniref:Uncharacterized protein n=1 Tax=Baudoinia panamericana (strain UAMH 10762) TaxID=717646 RepID=M2NAM8_BAUPA|nr:uncharacterized protein BAUCODRAFT_466465 [Baudoinia panamericana UAMH 10762]EMC96194.1 hypothetical protein BAUCODRAFT_466465 [Baudoinia panamericana UAMH 10762]